MKFWRRLVLVSLNVSRRIYTGILIPSYTVKLWLGLCTLIMPVQKHGGVASRKSRVREFFIGAALILMHVGPYPIIDYFITRLSWTRIENGHLVVSPSHHKLFQLFDTKGVKQPCNAPEKWKE